MAYIEKTYNDNGQIKTEVFINDGKKERIYKEYHLDGNLYIECNYINGKKSIFQIVSQKWKSWYWM